MVSCKLVQQLATSEKLKISIPYNPATLSLGIYDTHIYKGTYTRMFIVALLIIAPKWKESRCLSIEWINYGISIQQNTIQKGE